MESGSGYSYQQQSPAGGTAKANGGGVSTGLFVGVLILALCTFIALVLAAVLAAAAGLGLYAENARLKGDVAALNSRVAESEKLKADVASLNDRIEFLNDEATRLWIADDMRLWGVTDDFYTDDVVFYADNVVDLNAVVQPAFDDHYTGKGGFDVSDTELKDKLNVYVDEFERSYNNGKRNGMADFADLELQISVYGYDVATYKDGELTLD